MDRTVRLYDIYCHHVFPYFTLSKEEKHQLEEEVKAIYELQTVEDEAITKVRMNNLYKTIKANRNHNLPSR